MQPGIKMFTENAKFTTQIMALMVLANVAFLVLGLLTAKVSAKVLNVAQPTVWAAVTVLCVVGFKEKCSSRCKRAYLLSKWVVLF